MLKLSRYRRETDPIQDQRTGTVNRVVWPSRTQQARILDETTYQQLLTQDFAALPEEVVADLVDIELLVPASEDELKTILDRNAAAAADSRGAYLVVQPSALCQFGCGYCGQSHTNQTLSPDHQEKVIARARSLLQTGRYSDFEVGWFGAEPTLAMPAVRALTRGFQAVAAEHGCHYHAKMVTNGYLLGDDLATELVQDLDVTMIEVTLDGCREDHDRSRPTRGNGPSFDRVFANTVALARRQDLKVQLTVRCNVSRANRDGVLRLLELLAAEGVQERLRVYAAPIHDWGNQARADFGSPMEDFAAWEMSFFIHALELGFRPPLLPGRKEITCMVFSPGAELIDAYGNRFNCTEVSYVPAYEEPQPAPSRRFSLPLVETRRPANRYAIGHLDQPDEVPGRRAILGDFFDRVQRGEYTCHTCPMLPVCGGFCPKSWLEGTAACPSAKFNITQRLLLQYAITRGGFDDSRGQ